jgi:hypothetical protein
MGAKGLLLAKLALLFAAVLIGVATAGALTGDIEPTAVIVSDGVTPVPLPDGSGYTVIPPKGTPLPLRMAAPMTSEVRERSPGSGMYAFGADGLPGPTTSDSANSVSPLAC